MKKSWSGSARRKAGYRPHHPVLIVPGMCSSGLRCEAGYAKWHDSRIWLSLNKMGFQLLADRVARQTKRAFLFSDPLVDLKVCTAVRDRARARSRTLTCSRSRQAPLLRGDGKYLMAFQPPGKPVGAWAMNHVYLNYANRTLYWFKASGDKKSGAALGQLALDASSVAAFSSERPRPPSSSSGSSSSSSSSLSAATALNTGVCVCLTSKDGALYLMSESDELARMVPELQQTLAAFFAPPLPSSSSSSSSSASHAAADAAYTNSVFADENTAGDYELKVHTTPRSTHLGISHSHTRDAS